MRTLDPARLLALAGLLLLGACGDKADDTGDTDDAAGGGGGELDSVWDDHAEGFCDDNDYADQPGAVSYFLGEFSNDGGTWSGTEYWILYANDAWNEADNGQDCQIAWTVQLSETDVGSCLICEYGLEGGATLDASQTTCAQEQLWEGEENLSLAYDVDDDGTNATFYFAGSGQLLGAGHSNGGSALNYLSDPQCDWF